MNQINSKNIVWDITESSPEEDYTEIYSPEGAYFNSYVTHEVVVKAKRNGEFEVCVLSDVSVNQFVGTFKTLKKALAKAEDVLATDYPSLYEMSRIEVSA